MARGGHGPFNAATAAAGLVAPSAETTIAWVDRVSRRSAEMLAHADALALVLTRMVWPAAVREGIVVGDPDASVAERAVTAADVAQFATELTAAQRAEIAASMFGLDQAIIAEFARVGARAVERGWTEAQYIAAINLAAEVVGLTGFQTSWAGTWYSNLLGSVYNGGILSRFRREPTVRLFPFLVVVTVDDDARRPNHGHMQGFAASPRWDGWSAASPLYGHRCRCRLRPVTWQQARARGWSGLLAPGAAAQLSTWSGPDTGFSRPGLV